MGIAVFVLLVTDFLLHILLKKYKVLTKCLLMPLLIVFYTVSAKPINVLIILALVMGWAGDYFLTRSERPLFFEAGLAAFLVGHLIYSFILLQSTHFLQTVPVWFYSLAVLYVIAAAILFTQLKNGLKAFTAPFLVYCCAISLMSMLALSRMFTISSFAFWLPFAGSLLFIASDSLLAYGQFRSRMKRGDLLVMTTYVGAQVLLVGGLML
jgi:uncharacterized membrane protein YhhN